MIFNNKERLINTNEAIRYLGYGNNKPDEDMLKLIHKYEKDLLKVIEPKYLLHECKLIRKNEVLIAEEYKEVSDNIILSGNSISQYLTGCQKIFLCCATLSEHVDELINESQKYDMLKALLLDASANAAIEKLRITIEEILSEQLSDYDILPMFGFGYGDLPISILSDVLKFLDCKNKLGVYVNNSFVLIPMKSICGVIGIKEKNTGTNNTCITRCDICSMKTSCISNKQSNK